MFFIFRYFFKPCYPPLWIFVQFEKLFILLIRIHKTSSPQNKGKRKRKCWSCFQVMNQFFSLVRCTTQRKILHISLRKNKKTHYQTLRPLFMYKRMTFIPLEIKKPLIFWSTFTLNASIKWPKHTFCKFSQLPLGVSASKLLSAINNLRHYWIFFRYIHGQGSLQFV